jgi:hypothetical protein
VNGVALHVTTEQINQAKRLMTIASLETIRLIHVRAAHMTAPGCPVKTVAEKEMPTANASLMEGTNRFRVLFGHAIHGRRGTEGPEVQIDATFEIVYSFPQETNPAPAVEEMQAFAETNALMNCWPYWRELVQAMVSKMGLPPLVVPLLRWVMPTPQPKTVPNETPAKT